MFEDYASVAGVKQPQFCQPGIMQYLIENDKEKSNLKSLLPLPLTIDLKSSYSINFVRKFPQTHSYFSMISSTLATEFNCIATNKLPNGMRYSKAFLLAEKEFQNTTNYAAYRVRNNYYNMCHELGINISSSPQEVIKTLREKCASHRIKKCVVSTELNDILESAVNCSWASCYNPTGMYKEAPLRLALDTITAIATFYGEDDKKLGRCWVHIDYNGERLVMGRNYGNIAPECISHVATTLWSMLGNTEKYNEDSGSWNRRRHNTYIDTPTINWQHKSSPYKGKKATFKMGVQKIYCVHCGAEVEGHGFLCWTCLQKVSACGNCRRQTPLDSLVGKQLTTLQLYNGSHIKLCHACTKDGQYVMCSHCSRYMSRGHGRNGICSLCYDKLYIKCEWCGEYHAIGAKCDCNKRTCATCGQTKLKIHFTNLKHAAICIDCYLSGV